MGKVKDLSVIAEELKKCSQTLDLITSDLLSLTSGKAIKEEEEIPTLEDVRKVLAEKSKLGFTPQIKEIINSFNANKLSEVNPSDYLELLNKVRGLE
ncbi:hypothetical protein [Ligilactobacillus ceti]|uniref:rRNA biogenesis protein rrp5 n=1 Tax=Ligilactobacillus ceti DSM 22408 TaxID=1122146 RepID=A0A0R2KRG7_9LACO|nr:hypothetical protein [Ligilactobacillus ceti]KRN88708.1 hypothetical protein IV53_GL000675 [Ligilactobacillus ceti DSM 22408]